MHIFINKKIENFVFTTGSNEKIVYIFRNRKLIRFFGTYRLHNN